MKCGCAGEDKRLFSWSVVDISPLATTCKSYRAQVTFSSLSEELCQLRIWKHAKPQMLEAMFGGRRAVDNLLGAAGVLFFSEEVYLRVGLLELGVERLHR